MKTTFDCPNCGEIDVYDAIDECPRFYQRCQIIAKRYGKTTGWVVSSGQWTEDVSDEELGVSKI